MQSTLDAAKTDHERRLLEIRRELEFNEAKRLELSARELALQNELELATASEMQEEAVVQMYPRCGADVSVSPSSLGNNSDCSIAEDSRSGVVQVVVGAKSEEAKGCPLITLLGNVNNDKCSTIEDVVPMYRRCVTNVSASPSTSSGSGDVEFSTPEDS